MSIWSMSIIGIEQVEGELSSIGDNVAAVIYWARVLVEQEVTRNHMFSFNAPSRKVLRPVFSESAGIGEKSLKNGHNVGSVTRCLSAQGPPVPVLSFGSIAITMTHQTVTGLRRIVVLAALLFATSFSKAQEFRAAWADVFHVGTGSQAEVNSMVATLVAGHYNAVIVQVVGYMDSTGANSHGAHWKSSILPWSPRVTAGFDPLAYLCTQAHANGIEVHAWLGGSGAAMYRVSTSWPPAGNAVLSAHPEWFIAPMTNSEANVPVAVDGSYALDMGSPDVQEYIVSIVRELVTNYPIDGINWDDELNGTGYQQGFGYPAYSQANYARSGLARYRINTGVVGTPSNTDTAWSNYRRRFKNELMARVQAEMQSIKTNPRQPLRHTSAALAYSPVPTSCNFVGSVPYTYYCDWAGMLQNGWLDAVIPQTYSSSTVSNWAHLSASCWQYNRQIFTGIGGYLASNTSISNQIEIVRSKGLKGFATYSYAVANNSSPYVADWWAYSAANVNTNVVSTPPMPWRNPATATEGIVWGRVKDNATGLYVDDATVTVVGGPTVKTDGNGYYVATLVPAAIGGTAHLTTASKSGALSQSTNAIALPGDVVRYDFLLNAIPGPAAPSGLVATALSGSQIKLTWIDNATNETAFVIGRSTVSGGPYTDVASVTANTTAYTNNGLVSSTTYYYVVRATNSVGASTNSAQVSATTPAAPPTITAQPQNRGIITGQSVGFTVSAGGTGPLSYQWRFNGASIGGATSSVLALSGVQTNQAGDYTVVVTNSIGSVTSQVATLTVGLPFPVSGVGLLWSASHGTVASLPNERGMAYNAISHRLLVPNRSGPHVYVLDADTGADLYELNVAGVSGGTYDLLLAGVADDGVIYAGNLTTAGSTTAFKLYRWANDNSTTAATVVYSGDPGAGNNQRWGDTMDVRGVGTNTQIIIASRSGNVVALFTTTDGTSFASKLITVADAPTGAFGLGLGFGAGNTFWGKATSQNLRQVSFDPVAGTGATIRNHGSPDVPSTIAPIGVSTTFNLLGGINVGVTGNNFRLYNITPTPPSFVASANFLTDNDNTGTGTGAVDFGGDRVYALGANNGLIAMQLIPAVTPPSITGHPQSLTVIQGSNATFTVSATGSTLAYQWRFNGTNISGATASSFTRTNAQPADAGVYSVIVSNSANSVVSSNASLTVLEPPVVNADPLSQAIKAGTNVTFVASAVGTAPLKYQWQFYSTNIAGATNGSLTLTGINWSNAGPYVLTVTNAAGFASSAPAMLTVLPASPSHIDSIVLLPDGRVQVAGSGDAGNYSIEISTNLLDWEQLFTVPNTNGSFLWFDPTTNAPQRFYRARHAP